MRTLDDQPTLTTGAPTSDAPPKATGAPRPASFTRALVTSVVGLAMALGLALAVAMVWQGVSSTEEAARQEIGETLNRAVERLGILVNAAEMTAESAGRVARWPEVTGDTLRGTLERALAAFEQRPELSYVGIALPATGEYGNLERTASGEILLWLFPGTRPDDAMTRTFALTDRGFVLREERPSDGYDPRGRPFYRAALEGPPGGLWIPAYQWIVHAENSPALWGFSYVRALRDGAGRLLGVLDTDFDMPALNGFLASLAAEYHSRFELVELGATPRLIGGRGVDRAPLPVPADLAPLIKLTAADGAFVGRMALAGERRWVAARRMELKGGLSWLVVASRKDPFIEAPLRRQLYQVLAMGLAIVTGLVLVSVHVARRLGEPLRELERRIASIGQDAPKAATATASGAGGFRETRLLGEALDRLALATRQQARAREQQMASFALKAAIFDFTTAAIFSLDDHLRVIEWNAAAERLFGLARERVLGRPVAELVRAPDGSAGWTDILGGKDESVVALVGANGPFDAELRHTRFMQNDREIHTLVLDDISERRRAQARLEAFNAELEARVARRTRELETLNEELNSFCHSVSHDLRAPLRAIAGFAEILTRSHAGALDEKARDYLNRVQAATRRMGELIDDLLNLSRVSRTEMRRENVDLSLMARDILDGLQRDEPEREVAVEVEDGLHAEGDPRLLRIVLENLLGNAWKFTSKTPGARIAFTAADGDEGPAFAVGDNGAGFDMRYAAKLFAPFQRLHRTTEFPGTGIGLATVQRIVARHGGTISAKAEPGKGATFRFSL